MTLLTMLTGKQTNKHRDDERINLDEVKVDSSDILIVEGTVHRRKVRIILTYMGCSKEKKGVEYEVDPEMSLVYLGDMNGRLKSLEPHIETDSNGRMVENGQKSTTSTI